MIAITILSWASVVAVLVAYASRRGNWFHWANLVLCAPVALPAMLLGAWPSAAISLAFGAIAGWHLRQIRVKRRA